MMEPAPFIDSLDREGKVRVTSSTWRLFFQNLTKLAPLTGTVTLVAGTATVTTRQVTDKSVILLTVQSIGTVARPVGVGVTRRVAGESFTIESQDATDTSTIAWQITEPL